MPGLRRGRLVRVVGRAIGGVDRLIQLTEKLGIHLFIVRHGEITPADAALVRDDDVEPPCSRSRARASAAPGMARGPRRMVAMIFLLHQRPVAVEEDGASLGRYHFRRLVRSSSEVRVAVPSLADDHAGGVIGNFRGFLQGGSGT